ncbi:MAG TPA: IPT/TIG domain-containing protein [Polyangiaceae bacterium]|nr:IPT/TIG domain-containing protein [Polyangiaceae bacterium]
MRNWARPVGLGAGLSLLAALFAPGCLSRADAPFTRLSERDPDAAGGWLSIGNDDAGVSDASDELPPTAPHAVLGVNPPRGSFAGGNLALITGNGFGGNARVWFGDVELERSAIVPIDPQRIQVSVPPGHTGAVDVRVQNGSDDSTSAVLVGGYSYDQFYAAPSSGPTSGGTLITLYGDGTRWNQATEVTIDQHPCVVSEVISKTELTCTTPPGTPGSKPIRVSTSVDTDVLDAFVYSNSDNGFKGGLSGDTLRDELRVLVLNDITGEGVPAATVIIGDDVATADILKTDGSGVAVDSQRGLGPKRTVTVAGKCFQPQTFVDVDVARVTVFLAPILSPDCGPPSGDLPASGGSGVYGASVSGQIVWPASAEFKRDGWLHVPAPKSDDERLVAYVLRLSGSPTDRFTLPSASDAITPNSGGNRGYYFSSFGLPGNFTLYALAGIENRKLQPPTFTAYQMGLVRGVVAKSGETKNDVFVPIDVDLDHTLTLDLSPPNSTARGPDRVQASASIQVGSEGFAPLPNGFLSRDLPFSDPLAFVGVPTLDNSLLGTSYIVTARAVTGNAGSSPRSVVGLVSARDTSEPISLDEFVQVPRLTTPAPNAAWDGKALASTRAPGGAAVDLFVYEIESAGGLIAWKVIAPGSAESFSLPDLQAVGPDLGLSSGPITITVNAARVDNCPPPAPSGKHCFVYGALRYRDIEQRGWTAYASDVFFANY